MNNTSQSNFTYSGSIEDEINTINWIIVFTGRWIVPIIFLLGFTTNIINIYVFTRPALRKNPCCLYLLSSSVAALYYTIVVIPVRCLQYGYNINPASYLLTFCRVKFFLICTSRAVTVWYLALACFDRFLHSSSDVKLRQLSNVKVVLYTIPLTFILVNLVYIHVLFFYVIDSYSLCVSQPGIYTVFLSIWQLATYGLAPPIIMLILCLLTIRRTRQRRVRPITNQNNIRKDKNLFHTAFIQCIFVSSATLCYVVFQLYTSFTISHTKDRLQLAKDSLFSITAGCISTIGHTTTFFAFILTSQLFRQHLFGRQQARIQ